MSTLADKVRQRKEERKIPTNLDLTDINHNLIKSIFSISLYGKEAHDEDILELIIGGDADNNELIRIFEEHKAFFGSKMRKSKNGYYMAEGKIILEPIR